MLKKLIWLTLLSSQLYATTTPLPAVTIVPVANLAFQRVAPLFPNKSTAAIYKEMSLEGTKNSTVSCPRAHQLLFNERVEIIDRNADEVLVKIPQCYYITKNDPHTKNNEYWGLKSDFLPLANLEKQNLDTTLIPSAISFDHKIKQPKSALATLILPYKNQESGKTFSAGTRFVMATPAHKTDETVSVWAFDPSLFDFVSLDLNKNMCVTHAPVDPSVLRAAFVQLIRVWAQATPNHFIPYVWGGSSFIDLATNDTICTTQHANTQQPSSFSLLKKDYIATGFDCSGVILRAAQIFNIPYFAKNSFTALTTLKHVHAYEHLAQGDLIYIMGHLMIVADLEKNTLLEARSHYHGFGRLHEIKLNKEFKGIESYQQLINTINEGKTLERLDANGKVMARIQDAQLLKMPVEGFL